MTTEAEINEAHKQRFAEAQAAHGGSIPPAVLTELQEINRQEWIKFTNEQKGINPDAADPAKRNEKAEAITTFIDSMVSAVGSGNFVVTTQMLTGAGDCTPQTARKYIDEHPERFRATETKNAWIVLDPEVEKHRELAAEQNAAAAAEPPTVE